MPVPAMILEGGGELPAVLLAAVMRGIDEMGTGQVMQIISQEPSVLGALKEWVSGAGHHLLDTLSDGGVHQIWIRKAGQ